MKAKVCSVQNVNIFTIQGLVLFRLDWGDFFVTRVHIAGNEITVLARVVTGGQVKFKSVLSLWWCSPALHSN